ncbi:hypothetical protein OTU49_017515 [Cherax quadricarinatus]|uniref:Uncharacterized protein n=1 Tax=Cherax quadricarinatus TaxID=27406 RepID=A0AAW0YHT6_CHEQU
MHCTHENKLNEYCSFIRAFHCVTKNHFLTFSKLTPNILDQLGSTTSYEYQTFVSHGKRSQQSKKYNIPECPSTQFQGRDILIAKISLMLPKMHPQKLTKGITLKNASHYVLYDTCRFSI